MKKLVMGYTKTGDKMHLVDGDDLAVALCGRKIDHHVRRLENLQVGGGALVIYDDHWRDQALTTSRDRTCVWCLERERALRRR